MKKNKQLIFIFVLALVFLAYAVQPNIASDLPSTAVASSQQTASSYQAASSSVRAVSSSVQSVASTASSTPAPSSAVSSAKNVVSRLKSAASKAVEVSSSLPPATSPPKKAVANPMPAVNAKMPYASGTSVFSKDGAEVDYSNASQGYIMVKFTGSELIKVLVYYNGGSTYYQYNIAGSGAYVTLPLQSGSGAYRVRFMKNVGGNSYAEICSTELNAGAAGSGYTLYPNQYVSYTSGSAAVAKAKSLCASASSNAEKVAIIYKFVYSTVRYDYAKAKSVKSGYLPSVDTTLSTQKGICFDYAALMAAMCRAQGIPTKLVIGNTSVGYHAWNDIYLGGWKRYDATFAAAGQTAGTYTAENYY